MTADAGVSRETIERLDAYVALIEKWNPKINLVSRDALNSLRSRHIHDCTQLASLAATQTGTWLDLGSGGGLPGIVIAINRQSAGSPTIMMESDQRKAVFLRTVIRELNLSQTTVQTARIEEAQPLAAHHISARALAPLPKLLGFVHRHLHPDGTAWLMKGRSWKTEVEEAQHSWSFNLDVIPSITDPEAGILKIHGLRHA